MVREDGAGWQNWQTQVPLWTYPKDQERPKFARLAIPTTESVRYEYLLSLARVVGKVRPPGKQSCLHEFSCSLCAWKQILDDNVRIQIMMQLK